jgi:hypothetical protein
VEDEFSPFSQSVELAKGMERQGLLHEFCSYEWPKHYFSTRADGARALQMFQDALSCVHGFLSGE